MLALVTELHDFADLEKGFPATGRLLTDDSDPGIHSSCGLLKCVPSWHKPPFKIDCSPHVRKTPAPECCTAHPPLW